MTPRDLPAIDRFGGLDTDSQPLLVPLDETGRLTASLADNVILDQRSREIVRAPGSSALCAAALTGPPPRGVIEYIDPGSGHRSVIARTRTGYYLLNDARTTWTLLHAAALSDGLAIPSFAQLGQWLVVVDGEQALYWDGQDDYFSNWRPGSIKPPKYNTAAGTSRRPYAAGVTGTGFAYGGEYEFFFTFVNSSTGDESPPSGLMKVKLATSTKLQVDISTGYASVGSGAAADGRLGGGFGLEVIPAGVDTIRVYRSDSGLPGVWYQVDATVGGEAVVDTGSEGDELVVSLTGTTKADTTPKPTFSGPPDGVNVIVEHIQRLFVCGSPLYRNRLWWTEPGELSFPAANFMDFGGPGDALVALVSFPTDTPTLAALCQRSVYVLDGYDANTFVAGRRQIAAGPGCGAPHAVCRASEADGTPAALFWNQAGVYKLARGMVSVIDRGIHTEFLAAVQGVAA